MWLDPRLTLFDKAFYAYLVTYLATPSITHSPFLLHYIPVTIVQLKVRPPIENDPAS